MSWEAWFTLAVVGLVLIALIRNYATDVVVVGAQRETSAAIVLAPHSLDVPEEVVAASCGFATPLGYQTHLMVYGPGGYRFTDYLRIGVPLDLLCGVIAVILAPLIWPFH